MPEPQIPETRANGAEDDEFEALSVVIGALRNLSTEARQRVLGAVATFLGAPGNTVPRVAPKALGIDTGSRPPTPAEFSEDRAPGPKEFLFEKRPQTDVERIACLAYYLTHYRQTPHFKTLDLGKLNTEAAQLKLSNAAYAVDNATKAGLLVPAIKGNKQLSALGELYVQALPDRAAARNAIAHGKRKRRKRNDRIRGGQVDAENSETSSDDEDA